MTEIRTCSFIVKGPGFRLKLIREKRETGLGGSVAARKRPAG